MRGRLFLGALAAVLVGAAGAAGLGPSDEDVMEWSLEKLLRTKVQVSSLVSRKATEVVDTPAAVYVLGREQIQRSGAVNVAEALRLVPGLHVGRLDAHTWAISARGFNTRLANKMLVQIDGRSVYTNTLSGVLWEVQDVPLDEIERIEVVRGPGGTLWGVNAVNGIINVVTRPAGDTHGNVVELGGGTEERGRVGLRHGGRRGGWHYRIYGQAAVRDEARRLGGGGNRDEWSLGRLGFRGDWTRTEYDGLMVQGNFFAGRLRGDIERHVLEPPFIVPTRIDSRPRGGHLMARWTHRFSSTSDMALQAFFDRARSGVQEIVEDRVTLDVDFQHRFRPLRRHEVIWGVGGRRVGSEVEDSFGIDLEPDQRDLAFLSVFAQDEVELLPGRLSLTLGSKLEYTDLTGFELQPSARFLWKAAARHVLWGSFSQAMRTPSRGEQDGVVVVRRIALDQEPDGRQLFLVTRATRSIDAERLHAWEAGYRLRPAASVQVDAAAYLHRYDRLIVTEALGAESDEVTAAPHILSFIDLGNPSRMDAYGAEVNGRWQAAEGLAFEVAYANFTIWREPGLTPPMIGPKHQGWLRCEWDRGRRWRANGQLRYIGALQDETDETRDDLVEVDGYAQLDLRLAYRLAGGSEVYVVGQNLLRERQLEMVSVGLRSELAQIERGFYGGLRWRF